MRRRDDRVGDDARIDVRRSLGRRRATLAALVAAVVAVGLAPVLIDTGAFAARQSWTPIRTDTAAPPVADSFAAPNAVQHEADGGLLVADFAANGLLRRAPSGTWTVVAPFGTHDAAMWNPSAVTTTSDGGVLVAEAGRRTLTLLDRDGTVRQRFAAPPTSRAVAELAVTGSTVIAAAPGSGTLWTTELGSGAWSAVDGPWGDPSGVALSDGGDTLTVSDATADQVWQVDRATGVVRSLAFPAVDRARLLGVAVDAGDVFVVDNGGGQLWVHDDDGWAVAFGAAPDGSTMANPTAVSVGPDRELVVADYNRQRIVTAAWSGWGTVEPTAPATTPGADVGSTTAPEPGPTTTPEPGPTTTPEPGPTTTPEPGPTTTPEPGPTTAPDPAPTNVPDPAPTTVPDPGSTTAPTTAPDPGPTTAPTTGPVPRPTGVPEPSPAPTVPPSTAGPTGRPTSSPTDGPAGTVGPSAGDGPTTAAPSAGDGATTPGTAGDRTTGAAPPGGQGGSGVLAATGAPALLPIVLLAAVLVGLGALLRRHRA